MLVDYEFHRCSSTEENYLNSDSENTLKLFGLRTRQFCVGSVLFQMDHTGLGPPPPPQNTLRLHGCDSESLRFFAHCDFCHCNTAILLRFLQKKLATSLAICDCDCEGH